MILNSKNGVPFFQFPNLAGHPGARHAVFTRECGYSDAPYRSLNVSFGIGDLPGNVRRNRFLVSRCLEGGDFVYAEQNHGTDILLLSRNRGAGTAENLPPPFVGDAMVTDIPGKVLVIQVADCQSVLLYDPVRNVAANVHSGWRGSIRNIVGRTVGVMETHFDCRPEDVIAAVGPSLGPCCAEFVNYKSEIPEKFWKYKDGSDHFDFWSLSRDQLFEAGVSAENVDFSNMCTRCNTDRFFSYRGEGTTGRFAVAIGLKK